MEKISYWCDVDDCHEQIVDYAWTYNQIEFDWAGRTGLPNKIQLCTNHRIEFEGKYFPKKQEPRKFK